jgi:hypothetical protein
VPTFPRTVLPQEVEWPLLPTGLKAFGETGKAQLRTTQQVGRVWSEVYPPLKMTDTVNRAWLAQVEDYWRNLTILDVDHRSLRTLLGAGGGTPAVVTPASVAISTSANNTITVTTSTAHGFAVGDEIVVSGHTRSPNIDGNHTVTVVGSSTTFDIPSVLGAYVSGGGATGSVQKRATGASLSTNGWPASTSNVLRAGDVFKIAGLNIVFTVTADVSSDGSGNATILLNPPLYGGGLSAANGSALTLNSTPGTVKFRAIIDDFTMPRGRAPEIYVGLTLVFREVP